MPRRTCARLNFPTAAELKGRNPAVTHEVVNQVPYFENYNTYKMWPRFAEGIAAYGAAGKYGAQLHSYGKETGTHYWLHEAHMANKTEPVFTPFDRQGRRINRATLCESYHRLMKLGLESGITSLPSADKTHGTLASTTLFTMHTMLEQGSGCPITMTAASVTSLESTDPATGKPSTFYDEWIKKMTTADYDQRDIHISYKAAATCGMSMTEKQGGSDVRLNTTYAVPVEAGNQTSPGAPFLITGHKWFTSAPMCDSFLTLAYTADNEISCFLIPRWVAPEERNVGLRFQRLKSKLGDKSNASSEVEYNEAVGWLVGERSKGVKVIIQMVNHTRLLCISGGVAIGAVAVSNAIHHTSHRKAFGDALIDKPLMQNVLVDLSLEIEGQIALMQRVAHSFDDADTPGKDPLLTRDYARMAVAIGKYATCKRTPALVNEAMECLGGNGYLEDLPLARYYRQAPLNAIWEGSGNVIVLDFFRAINKDKQDKHIGALIEDITSTGDKAVIGELNSILSTLKKTPFAELEMSGRRIVERLGVLLQASALYHSKGDMAVYEAFVNTRIGAHNCARGVQFGTLDPKHVNIDIVKRNTPIIEKVEMPNYTC